MLWNDAGEMSIVTPSVGSTQLLNRMFSTALALISASPTPPSSKRFRSRAGVQTVSGGSSRAASCSRSVSTYSDQYFTVLNHGNARGKAGSCQRRAIHAA